MEQALADGTGVQWVLSRDLQCYGVSCPGGLWMDAGLDGGPLGLPLSSYHGSAAHALSFPSCAVGSRPIPASSEACPE